MKFSKFLTSVWLVGSVLLVCDEGGSIGVVGRQTSPKGRGRGSRWWAISLVGEPSNLIPSTIRNNRNYGLAKSSYIMESSMQGILRKKQERLIRENRGILDAVARGTSHAIHECKYQFRNRRWNCPTKPFSRGKNIFGRIVDRGCRETSFLYAMTSSAVTHAVVKACSDGTIESCTCDYRLHRRLPGGTEGIGADGQFIGGTALEQNWKWGSCSDNIEFGIEFSRNFVDAGERARDLRGSVNLHNNEAGRLHVQSLMRRQCKCHGMSGSCTVKTCWMKLPHLREVSRSLKDRFDGASRVHFNNAGSLRNPRDRSSPVKYKFQLLKPYYADHKPPSVSDLVFYEDSPNFCHRNSIYGFGGTSGRICNVTSLGVDGCDLMCCGRGHSVTLQTVTRRCQCLFKWCCEVECQNCTVTEEFYRCK